MSRFDIVRTAPLHPLRPLGGERPAMREASSAPAAAEPGVRVDLAGPGPDLAVPVDHERVALIREALRDGTYPIVPARIADALIAARLALGGQA